MNYEEKKKHNAYLKAKNRGEKSIEWHKTNELTSSSLSEFKRVMKQADKDWELLNKNKKL